MPKAEKRRSSFDNLSMTGVFLPLYIPTSNNDPFLQPVPA